MKEDGYNLKSIKQKFKEKGIYYTPPELVEMMKSYIDIDFKNVYDPTCGDGGLLKIFGDEIVKYGQEINEHQLEVAKEEVNNFKGYLGNTLSNPGFMGEKFDLIMANPPFSIKWEPQEDIRFNILPAIPTQGKADYAFLAHIIHYLSDEGQALVLQFPGILYRGNREGKIRQWFVEQNYIEKIIQIPENTFVDTKIATVLLVLRKNKKTTDIIFEDKGLKKTRIVKKQEIIKNDFILSVNNYVFEEIKKPVYDPLVLQNKSRTAMLEKLKRDIQIDMMVCEMEGYDKKEYIEMLLEVINNLRS